MFKWKISLVSWPATGEFPPVKLTKTLSSLSPLLAMAPGMLNAQTAAFDFSANSVANYRQGPAGVAYEGGTFGINVRDGNVLFQGGCVAPLYFPPSIPCPLGATGYISEGDINGDGVQDTGSYLSVTSIIDSTILRPFVAQQAQLVSAPPSLLPRPIAGFVDNSQSVFFNIQTNFIRQYAITEYDFSRQYMANQRSRFDGEVVPGTYRYLFGSRASTTIPQPISITLFPKLDGFRKINNQRQGFQFTGLTYDDDFAVLNPNVINTVTWTGNDVSLIAPGLDTLYFSIKPLADPTDPLSDPVFYDGGENFVEDPPGSGNIVINPTLPIFPNFAGPGITRVLLPSALNQSYTIPPQFLAPGATGLIDLEFVLNRPTSASIGDRSTIRFRLPVKVSDPLAMPPPPNMSSALYNDPSADADNDGVSNFDEWVFGSDRGNAASTPKAASLNYVPPVASTPSSGGSLISTFSDEETSGHWEFKVEKKRNPDPKLKYEIQRSTDMVNWTTIQEGDPDWILVDDNIKSEIKVVTRDSEVKGGGFFRAKVTEIPK